jgi:hypothetical protein
MPLYKRCDICGRLCDITPKRAEPYSTGYCCNECYLKNVLPAKEKERDRARRKKC